MSFQYLASLHRDFLQTFVGRPRIAPAVRKNQHCSDRCARIRKRSIAIDLRCSREVRFSLESDQIATSH